MIKTLLHSCGSSPSTKNCLTEIKSVVLLYEITKMGGPESSRTLIPAAMKLNVYIGTLSCLEVQSSASASLRMTRHFLSGFSDT